MVFIFAFQVDPTLKHQDLLVLRRFLENRCGLNLLEYSARKCNHNFAISSRWGVGSISAGWVRPSMELKTIASDI